MGQNVEAVPTPKAMLKEVPKNCWPGKWYPEGLGWAGEQTVTLGCHLRVKRLPGLGLLNSGRTPVALPSWGPDCPRAPPAPRGSVGWPGRIFISPAERPASWQTGAAPSLPTRGVGRGLSICLSVRQEGSCVPGLPRC